MLKGIYNVTKGVAKKYFDVPSWFGSETIRDGGSWVGDQWKQIAKAPKAQRKETFEEAQERFGLNDQELLQRYQVLRRNFFLILFMMCLEILYFAYLINHADFHVLLASCIIFIFLITQAFRYSYLACQISKRKLKCSLGEWWSSLWGI